MNFICNVVPQTTFDFLDQFKDTADYEQIIREREFIVEHNKQYSSLKYPPIRINLPQTTAPTSSVLEESFYFTSEIIFEKVKKSFF
jgi:hypothetical protein